MQIEDLTFVVVKGLSAVDLVFGGPFTQIAYLRQPLNGAQGAGDVLRVPIGSYVIRDTSGTFHLATSAEVTARFDATTSLGTAKPTGLTAVQGEDPSGVSVDLAWTDASSNKVEVWRQPYTKNLVVQSQALNTTWTASVATIAANSVLDPNGAFTADVLTRVAAATDKVYQAVSFTGNGVKAVSVHIKKGTARVSEVALYDATGAAYTLRATVTWGANGAPTVAIVSAAGVYVGLRQLPNGWFRLLFTTTTITAASTNNLYLIPGSTGASNGDTTAFWGVQAVDHAVNDPYVATTTAALQDTTDRFAFLATINAGVQVYSDVTPTADQKYEYKVRHVVNATAYPDYSTFTATASVTPQSEQITDLAASVITNTSAHLAWTQKFAVNHNVYKNGVFVATVTAGTYTYDPTLVEGTVSVWTVKPSLSGTEGPASNAVSIQSLLAAPSALASDVGNVPTTTTAQITWTDAQATYLTEIWRATGAGASTWQSGEAGGIATKAYTGLVEGSTYHFKIRHTKLISGVSYASAFTAVVDIDTLLTAPNTLACTAHPATSETFTWVVGNALYSTEVWQAAGAGSMTLKATTAATIATKQITGLTTGTMYHTKIRHKYTVSAHDYFSVYSSTVDQATD